MNTPTAKTYPCCKCCPGDPIFHEDNPADSHEVPVPVTAKPRRIPHGSIETFLEARELLALLGPDLDADRHWIDMGREVGSVCRICDEQSRGEGFCENHYRRHLRASRKNEAARINRQNRSTAA